MYTKLDLLYIIFVAILVFSLTQGASLPKRIYLNVFKFSNLEFITVCGIFLFLMYQTYKYLGEDHTLYCIGENKEKRLAEVKGNTVNINNPNINLPSSVSKAHINIVLVQL